MRQQTGVYGTATNGRPIPKRTTATDTTYYGRYDECEIDTEDDSEYEPPRMPTSTRRYMPEGTYTQGNTRFNVKYAAPPQRPAPLKRHPVATDEVVIRKRRQKEGMHWMVFMGVGMLVMLVLWILGIAALNWVNSERDTMTYGYPRMFQTDYVVGHNDSSSNPSHFIALNLNRHVEVIELLGGDGSHARIYMVVTLVGDGQELTPVTLSFKDVNNDGKPDMLIHIGDQTLVYINDNGQFRPVKPGEKINV